MADAIPSGIRGTLSVDDFCVLLAVLNVDRRIQITERNLAAARDQDLVRTTPEFNSLNLPTFDIDSIRAVFERDLPALSSAAAARVQQHLSRIGSGSEARVADGMQRIVHTENRNDIYPFSAQDLSQSSGINHYREYFGEEYRRLRQTISDALNGIEREHGQNDPARFERAVMFAIESNNIW